MTYASEADPTSLSTVTMAWLPYNAITSAAGESKRAEHSEAVNSSARRCSDRYTARVREWCRATS